MYKVLFSFFAVLVLLWGCNSVYAETASTGGNATEAEVQESQTSSAASDGNQVSSPAGVSGQEDQGQMQQRRQKNLDRLRKRRRTKTEEIEQVRKRQHVRPEPERLRGEGTEQQAANLEVQLQRESEKHLRRIARLDRIRELGVELGREDVVSRAEKLKRKEQMRYSRKHQRMQAQMRRGMRTETRQRNVRPPEKPVREGAGGAKRGGYGRGAKGEMQGRETRTRRPRPSERDER
jgi:uncharacterized protein YceK